MKEEKKIPSKQNKDPKKPLMIVLSVALLITASYTMFWDEVMKEFNEPSKEVSISELQKKYNEWEIKELKIWLTEVSAKTQSWSRLFSYKLPNETVSDLWFNNESLETIVKIKNVKSWAFWKELVVAIIPIIIIFIIISYVIKQSWKWMWWGFWFWKSKAKRYEGKDVKTKFDEVAGCEESKAELVEVVDFLKNPKKYEKMWAKIPKWTLLVGSPGTWKTLLAKAVAWEAWVPFFSISGSEFVEMFVWVWASRVRDLFSKAKKSSPSIIFIDEIDAIWKQRWYWMWWWHDEREQTLNQILTEMDWFETGQNVIIIAATNRPEILDKALLRPWRFDRQIIIDKPDLKARIEILNVHWKTKKLWKDINIEEVAKKTPWFTGADLANVMNEAAILAARFKKKDIEQEDLMEAIEKWMMGPQKKSSVLSEKEKKIIAYHEIWHAIVSKFMPESDPVHKITMIPRWRSLWSTWYLPNEETKLYSETKFAAELASLYWGHMAEKIQFWEVTTWASNDIERATAIARSMVTQYWMSPLWPIQWEQTEWSYAWHEEVTKNHSNEFARKIDEEVTKILQKAIKKAEQIIKENKKIFEDLSQLLLKKETISAKEFENYFKK